MRMKEASLAYKAFAAALGQPEPYPQNSREALIESLAEDYQFFGVASGRHHTEQLVRILRLWLPPRLGNT